MWRWKRTHGGSKSSNTARKRGRIFRENRYFLKTLLLRGNSTSFCITNLYTRFQWLLSMRFAVVSVYLAVRFRVILGRPILDHRRRFDAKRIPMDGEEFRHLNVATVFGVSVVEIVFFGNRHNDWPKNRKMPYKYGERVRISLILSMLVMNRNCRMARRFPKTKIKPVDVSNFCKTFPLTCPWHRYV